MVDIAIIGGGPAGLTAAIYAQRAGLHATVWDGGMFGGQAASTGEIENYPAIEKISGVDFAIQLYQQATAQGVELRAEEAIAVELESPIKRVASGTGFTEARAIILANGAKRRLLGCPGEQELSGRGVSYCATCDGAFFRGKDVAVVGGGNTALEDALFLSNNCRKVYLIHRRNSFRAEQVQQDAVRARANIELLLNTQVERIQGDRTVDAIQVAQMGQNKSLSLRVSAVFVAVGMQPQNQMFSPALPLDASGYLIADETCATPIPGVFAAGDTRTTPLRQIITAAADGAVAAVAAASYINERRWEQAPLL